MNCGRMANEWAYDHSDPNECVEWIRGKRYPFSLDVGRYRPLCRSCHVSADRITGPQRRASVTPKSPVIEFEPGVIDRLPFVHRSSTLIDLCKPPEWTGIRRRCFACGMIKDEGSFSWRGGNRTGRMGRCRHCDAVRQRARYMAGVRRATPQAPKSPHGYSPTLHAKHRARAIEVYGGRCVWCDAVGELEFDHPDNDGAAHRRAETTTAMLRRISRTGRPLDDWRLQLLCTSCHRSPQWKVRRATGTPVSSTSSG